MGDGHEPDRAGHSSAPRGAARPLLSAGWVSGTGGGICGPADGGGLLLAPTGVHKERVRPDEFFTSTRPTGGSAAPPPIRPCGRANAAHLHARGPRARRRSVVHSHALSAVLAGDLAGDGGPRRHPGPRDAQGHPRPQQPGRAPVPVVDNTARERSWSSSWPRRSRTRGSRAPGASWSRPRRYIWGDGHLGGEAPHRGLSLPVRGRRRPARPRLRRRHRTPHHEATLERGPRPWTFPVSDLSAAHRTPGSTSSTWPRPSRRTS